MSWQFDPLAALSELRGTPAKVAKVAKVGLCPPASADTLAGLSAPTRQGEEAEEAHLTPSLPHAAGPVASLSPTLAEPHWSCYCCKGQSYFINLGQQVVCARCHPPVDPICFPVH
jgi:hypothetical protein